MALQPFTRLIGPTRPDPEAAAIAEALGQPARLHRQRLRQPRPDPERASGPVFGDKPGTPT